MMKPMRYLRLLLIYGTLVVFVGIFYANEAQANVLPDGRLDVVSQEVIYGWAYDPDAGTNPVTVHIYVNGTPWVALTANERRDDLVRAGVTPDPYHGFAWRPADLEAGTYRIQAFAINRPDGVNPELKFAKTLTITNRSPRGVLDGASPDYVSGWAFDPDVSNQPIFVHIYIDGVHRGTVLANDRRDDLVSAGVTSDPYHGFSWNPPTLSRGTHTVQAFAINTPNGVNPELLSSPRQMTVGPGFQGVSFLENSGLKLGVHLGWGGAITHISHNGENLVDDHDTGRLLQAAFYDMNEDYSVENWGWNPVQGGDKHNQGSEVLLFSKTENTIYTKSRPLEWNPDNKGGGVGAPVSSNMTLETWVTLSDTFPQLVEVRHKVLLESGPSRQGNNEAPAVFLEPQFGTFVAYRGDEPWQDEPVSFPTFEPFPFIEVFTDLAEYWSAWVNPGDFGLTVYAPNHSLGTHANAYWVERVTRYLRPGLTNTLQPGVPFEITYYLIVGNHTDARSLIYDLRGVSR